MIRHPIISQWVDHIPSRHRVQTQHPPDKAHRRSLVTPSFLRDIRFVVVFVERAPQRIQIRVRPTAQHHEHPFQMLDASGPAPLRFSAPNKSGNRSLAPAIRRSGGDYEPAIAQMRVTVESAQAERQYERTAPLTINDGKKMVAVKSNLAFFSASTTAASPYGQCPSRFRSISARARSALCHRR